MLNADILKHGIISGAEGAGPSLGIPIFGTEGSDAGSTLGTVVRLSSDGLSLCSEGGVEVTKGHHDFMCSVASGRYSMENSSPASVSFVLFHVNHV